MATTSYTIRAGDKFSPFTGKAISYPAGTVIYGDYSTQKDYGKTAPSTSTSTSTTQPKTTSTSSTTSKSSPTQTSSSKYAVQNSWNLTSGQWNGVAWVTKPTLTIDGKNYTFNNPTELVNALNEMKSSGATNINSVLPYYTQQAAIKPSASQQTQAQSNSAPKLTTPIDSSQQLKVGSKGDAVKALQTFLGITADGIFGPNTEKAVKDFQAMYNLSPDGIVGPKTFTAINNNITSNTNTNTSQNTNNNQTPTGGVNEYNPNTGVKLAPGETVLDQTTGKYVTQGQVGQTDQPLSQPSVSSNYQEDYNKSGDTASSLYGQAGRNSEWEQPAFQQQAAIQKAAGESNIVSSSFLKTLAADPSIVGFYVNALAYGGYTMGDVLNDMKRRELISKGNTEAKTLKIIDPELNRTMYQSTSDGQKAMKDTAKIIPTFNLQGLVNPEILKYGANIPDELFKTLVPILDKNSKEFKDAVAKVKATYYDLATATLQATTEQEKAVADYNLKNFTEQINKQYGILLSDDATKAWSQIEALEDTMSTRGISGSGMEAEGIDSILATTRKQDQRLRDEKLTKEEIERASFYTSSASAAQIAALTDEERQKYGLKPSPEILKKFSIAELKKQYPNKPDDEIKAMHDAVLDENGNYRSTLYSKYFSKAAETAITNQTNAEQQVLLDAQNRENKAYRNYDQSQPFSVATKEDLAQMKSDSQTSTQSTNPVRNVTTTPNTTITPAQSANISAAINNFNSNTGAQLKPGETYINSEGQKITQGTPISTTPKTTVNTTPSPVSTVSTQPKTTVTAPTPTPTVTKPTTYKITYGDTLGAIAARNNTTIAKLAALNGIKDPNKISAGTTIKLQ